MREWEHNDNDNMTKSDQSNKKNRENLKREFYEDFLYIYWEDEYDCGLSDFNPQYMDDL